jgi:hypothetical protein
MGRMTLQLLTRIETRVGPLDVYHGHDDNVVGQLGKKSQSIRMQRNVPRDGGERFKTPRHFSEWVAKGAGGRMTYAALDPNRLRDDGQPELAVFSWLGEEQFPSRRYRIPEYLRYLRPDHTYAIRSYGLQEGAEDFYERTGGAKRVSQVAIAHYAGERLLAASEALPDGVEPAVFLETDADNDARTGLYPHLYGEQGYIDLEQVYFDKESGKERAAMVLPLGAIAACGIPLPHWFVSA